MKATHFPLKHPSKPCKEKGLWAACQSLISTNHLASSFFCRFLTILDFTHICREFVDVPIYALYPESFCVENLDIRLFLTLICKTKEFGLNRETKRFMKLQITVDKFHQVNHTSCGDTFKSSEYSNLNQANTQACEQTNRKLRKVAKSCTFMNPDMYMRSLTLYLAYQNILKSS